MFNRFKSVYITPPPLLCNPPSPPLPSPLLSYSLSICSNFHSSWILMSVIFCVERRRNLCRHLWHEELIWLRECCNFLFRLLFLSIFSFITNVIRFTWISYFSIAHFSHQFIFSYLILYLLSFLHLLSVCPTRRYSRVPVYRGDVDNIVGVVYSKDLLEVRYCCVCCYSLSLSVYKVN